MTHNRLHYILGNIIIGAGTIIALIGVARDNSNTVFFSGVAILFAGIAIATAAKKQQNSHS